MLCISSRFFFVSSSLIKQILNEANGKKDSFRVIVVDSRPTHEGQAMIKRLVKIGIECKTVLISALGFIMPEVALNYPSHVVLGKNVSSF
jgi:translation initiation factor 2B subunit (eIF-2B alpha/beta/delta family)